MGITVFGVVFDQNSNAGVAGVLVQARDSDFLHDRSLGEALTQADGSFSIEIREDSDFRPAEKRGIHLVIKTRHGEILKTTTDKPCANIAGNLKIDVGIEFSKGSRTDPERVRNPDWMRDSSEAHLEKFVGWTWRSGSDESDPMARQLTGDLSGCSSVLELMKRYMDQLNENPAYDCPAFQKLEKLFELGQTPESLEGHFYGVTLGLKSGHRGDSFSGLNNFLGFLWGRTLADECPWVGKSFSTMEEADQKYLPMIDTFSDRPCRLGINHFNRLDLKILNTLSFGVLTLWLGLENASNFSRHHYGHEREGGFFVAHRGPSVMPGLTRDVYRLNYRFRTLDNPVPLRWLIDELVGIADGLYLGQLLFATRNLETDYDPGLSPADDDYRHFGYFILFDDTWNHEARRLFAHLEIPVTAPGVFQPKPDIRIESEKFSTFTLEDPVPANADDKIFTQVQNDLQQHPSILHLLKFYSDHLQRRFDNTSPYFQRLREIFHRGTGFGELEGFYRGALVSWRSQGLFRFLDVNTLNAAWMTIGRFFSPWTGKTFEPMPPERLTHFTDGFEKGETPTFWGANTQALRTPKEKFVGRLMKLANIWTEEVPGDEARELGYDVKCFFFIARRGTSVNEDHRSKPIFQLNYRWPRLKTFPPDCYCIDELVRIADGLYLGQLMYATHLTEPYDPAADPGIYRYRNFGYFLLMDPQWHAIRLEIGFDLQNV